MKKIILTTIILAFILMFVFTGEVKAFEYNSTDAAAFCAHDFGVSQYGGKTLEQISEELKKIKDDYVTCLQLKNNSGNANTMLLDCDGNREKSYQELSKSCPNEKANNSDCNVCINYDSTTDPTKEHLELCNSERCKVYLDNLKQNSDDSGPSLNNPNQMPGDSGSGSNSQSGGITDRPVDCDGMAPLIAFVMKLFRWTCIIMGVALVIFGMLDFGGVVMSSDADAMKKATKKFTTRIIVFVIMVLLPVLIDYAIEELFFHGKNIDSCIAMNINDNNNNNSIIL